ncbi:hypothetical protein QF018_001913 [Pseudomonas laurylsulfatiphila]|nr:hypothetical protein [Pseudomonas reinekei]
MRIWLGCGLKGISFVYKETSLLCMKCLMSTLNVASVLER